MEGYVPLTNHILFFPGPATVRIENLNLAQRKKGWSYFLIDELNLAKFGLCMLYDRRHSAQGMPILLRVRGGSPVVPEGVRCPAYEPEEISRSALLLQVSAVISSKRDFRQVVKCGPYGLFLNTFIILPAVVEGVRGNPNRFEYFGNFWFPQHPFNSLGKANEIPGAHVECRNSFILDGALFVGNIKALMGPQCGAPRNVE